MCTLKTVCRVGVVFGVVCSPPFIFPFGPNLFLWSSESSPLLLHDQLTIYSPSSCHSNSSTKISRIFPILSSAVPFEFTLPCLLTLPMVYRISLKHWGNGTLRVLFSALTPYVELRFQHTFPLHTPTVWNSNSELSSSLPALFCSPLEISLLPGQSLVLLFSLLLPPLQEELILSHSSTAFISAQSHENAQPSPQASFHIAVNNFMVLCH